MLCIRLNDEREEHPALPIWLTALTELERRIPQSWS